MARKTKQEQQIISRKIMTLRGEGFKRKQAAAIALRMYRDGELPRPVKPPRPPNRLKNRIRKTRTRNYRGRR